MKKNIAILGSTGSIGSQALEVIREHRDKFDVEVLTAQRNLDMLVGQAIEFKPNAVVIGDESLYPELRDRLEDHPVKVFAGKEALCQVVQMTGVDMVLTAMVGYAGLKPTISAIEAGKDIALANKETLVVAGQLIIELARKKQVRILPVDSEHSAIYQCLAGEGFNRIEKIYLTASGGPFRTFDARMLQNVTPGDALNHPNWVMGAKITIDSASLMNKGLEAIEAKWLFHLDPAQIEVLVHPQSIVHSMVQFEDGSIKAQLGLPDMKLPILYALSFPERMKTRFPRLDFSDAGSLTFERADQERFRNLDLAYQAMKQGGNIPCALNAANEIAVQAFLDGTLKFTAMPDVIEHAIQRIHYIKAPVFADFEETDTESRRLAMAFING
jgi:1-deoxy-D-xylulose-5-phosphate reductoisomerase